MLLEYDDAHLFFRLHRTLMFFVNQRLGVIPEPLATPEDFAGQPYEARLAVRNALMANVDLIETFASENPAHLSDDELDIIRSWRHFVQGKFFIYRELARHTVFLTTCEPFIAYGVTALTQPFEDFFGSRLPAMVETMLLQFKDKIVYDGLLGAYHVSLGPGIRRSLAQSYKEAKATLGIVTTLALPAQPRQPAKASPRKTAPAPTPATPSKDKAATVLAVVIDLIERFCREKLNEEYATVCVKLARKLSQKRPSPLTSGKPAAWASGIVRTVGMVNFLHDKSQDPHMRMTDIDAGLGVGQSTGAAKAQAIRKMLDINYFDPEYSLPSRMSENPFIWMLKVNGIMMDIRHTPREVQEIAFNQGLIPYIPADRQEEA